MESTDDSDAASTAKKRRRRGASKIGRNLGKAKKSKMHRPDAIVPSFGSARALAAEAQQAPPETPGNNALSLTKQLKNKVTYTNAKLSRKEEEVEIIREEANLLKLQHLDKDDIAVKLRVQIAAAESTSAKLSTTLTLRTGRFTDALAKTKARHSIDKQELIEKATAATALAKQEKATVSVLEAALKSEKAKHRDTLKLEKTKHMEDVRHIKNETEQTMKDAMKSKVKSKVTAEREKAERKIARSSRAHRASFKTLKVRSLDHCLFYCFCLTQ